ncbi:MAG: MobF family relaxase [Thermoleophilia bacterium]
MLTAARLRPAGAARTYYERTVATDREAYYAGEGEARGEWAGTGAQHLGLTGEVADGELSVLLDGRHPVTGEVLRRVVGERVIPSERLDPVSGERRVVDVTHRPVVGFDLTFEAPKSVSLLHALTDEPTRAQVAEAHRAAWRDALVVLERYAAVVRSGPQGIVRERTGLVAAGFVHRTNRDGDPHLHTHVVIANLGLTGEGTHRALDGRLLLADWRTAAGHVYQARLRAELTERLGVQWGPVRAGQADLAGVPRGVIEEFSRRRAAVLEEARARGADTHAGRRVAQVATRAVKRSVDLVVARERWRARAAERGLDAHRMESLRGPARTPIPAHSETLADAVLGHSGATPNTTSLSTADLVRAVCDAHPDGATAQQVLDAVEALTRDPRLERLPAPALGAPERFVPVELVRVEERVLEAARQGRDRPVARAYPDALTHALTHTPFRLTEEQERAATLVARTEDRVACVIGHAGAGKTTALAAASMALRASGVGVRGCAPSAQAARILGDATGIPTSTLHALLTDLRAGTLTHTGSCVIVDEASMADTPTLAALIHTVTNHGGRVVLVGDPAQLPAVGPGGLFAALTAEVQTTELVGNRRQHAEWERDALAALRAGDAHEALAAYAARGRITQTPDTQQARARLVEDWWTAARETGVGEAVMLAHRNRDVDDLNALARERMRQTGRLGAEHRYANAVLAVGDRVICRLNDHALHVRNGTRGRVESLTPDHVELRTDDGELRTLPAEYAAEHVRHAYALTVHAAQGATVDHAYVLASDSRQLAEWGYVALTRARTHTHLYLTAEREPIGALDPGRTGGLDALAQAMTRATAEPLATDQLAAARSHTESLRTEAAWIRQALRTDQHARDHRDPRQALDARRQQLMDARDTTRPLTRARRELTRSIRAIEHRIAQTPPAPPPSPRPEPPRPELADLSSGQLQARLTEITHLLHPEPEAARTPERAPTPQLPAPEIDFGPW